MKTALILTLIASLTILSACGWRLRGSDTLNIKQNIYLAPASGEIYQNIRREITRKRSEVSIAEADIQLVLGDEFFNERNHSVNNQLQPTQYQLVLSIPYEILDPSGKPLIPEATAKVSRYYTFNRNAITSSDREKQTLRKEMVRAVSRQILRRVHILLRK
ncbi:hypothetical protein AB835_14010 [Candidatus Endobugula sertula]|uniref:LPS-assembly lipoprotein LptE n=1 Tax=Candidatus Endobugula sertula TaxID=62101 RepID=A0A1D2QLL4_9GAMM|nr:hypothetical protein AB835_14010 [Candidatus Endobugula sertula]